jgi:Tfp pilus assembly protein PilN
VARIWEELARLVPTTTFLTEVEVGSRFVQLSGLSASAPELIKILEGSVLLQDVSFAGPIVLDAAAGKERFTLRASLRQVRDPVEERG